MTTSEDEDRAWAKELVDVLDMRLGAPDPMSVSVRAEIVRELTDRLSKARAEGSGAFTTSFGVIDQLAAHAQRIAEACAKLRAMNDERERALAALRSGTVVVTELPDVGQGSGWRVIARRFAESADAVACLGKVLAEIPVDDLSKSEIATVVAVTTTMRAFEKTFGRFRFRQVRHGK